MRTVMLGPQRFQVNATTALRSLGTEGPVAVVNSGWEEREDVVGELDVALDGRADHLRLYHRFLDVLEKDDRFASAALRYRDRHVELMAIYRLRVANTLAGVRAVQRRLPPADRDRGLPPFSTPWSMPLPVHQPPAAGEPAGASPAADAPPAGEPVTAAPAGDSTPGVATVVGPDTSVLDESPAYDAIIDTIAGVRRIDAWYLTRLAALEEELAEVADLRSSPVIGWHRAEIAATIARAAVVVLPGGDVTTLMRTLRLFDVRIPDTTPVIAWSAGAMALTSHVVLFHDFGPEGATEPEVYDRGLGRVPHLVAFPHAKRRLRLDDRIRASVLAHRFGDARCLMLDDGAWVEFGPAGTLLTDARVLGADGTVRTLAAARRDSGVNGG